MFTGHGGCGPIPTLEHGRGSGHPSRRVCRAKGTGSRETGTFGRLGGQERGELRTVTGLRALSITQSESRAAAEPLVVPAARALRIRTTRLLSGNGGRGGLELNLGCLDCLGCSSEEVVRVGAVFTGVESFEFLFFTDSEAHRGLDHAEDGQ
jgi:hypothetical protein